ncbi:hypothetical protein GOP47_0020479 [Adiantum capillus-veneris]|uniref:Uncharacterized protein n=1 Tax=Adiantum capillus-veneris TaxID=13818 RepID=A0A9D4UAV3_ADICA|nr:hypothetical protein GOP47_0020479 [Adiantum capillus-veneris]
MEDLDGDSTAGSFPLMLPSIFETSRLGGSLFLLWQEKKLASHIWFVESSVYGGGVGGPDGDKSWFGGSSMVLC